MILLTGATGYVGQHLLPALQKRGHSVRCLSRKVDRLPQSVRGDAVEGDILDEATLRKAMSGVQTAYYLVHAMTEEGDFAETEKRSAKLFGQVAREVGVRRIIYLGGLGSGDKLSEHLASRQEVGRILKASGVPVIEFRASVIIGAGSTSFELSRTLVDKLPFMVTPRWVRTLSQPIAISDVVEYLVEAVDVDLPQGGVFEIGGSERVSYGDLMSAYARQRGLKRWMIPVPVLTPNVSSLWLALVVPRYAKVGRLLIEGVRNETTVHDDAALRVFSVRPMALSESVRRALFEIPPETAALKGASAVLAFIASLIACFGAAGVGGLLSSDSVSTWYPTITKPEWTPPSWIFGPVWSVLYLMMAVAAWRVWRWDGWREARLSLGLFMIHLAFNAAWSGLFFGLRRPDLAFVEIIALWILILATTLLFSARDRLAGVLMLPYLAWVSFATVLNGAIAYLNS